MNCNSNTMRLRDIENVTLDTCTQSCTILPINLVCNSLIVPPSEMILGAQYNKNSDIKKFYLPLKDSNGTTWLDKQFYILTEQNEITNKIQILGDNIKINDSFIELIWKVDDTTTANSGTIQVQLEIFGEEYQFYSNKATFTISESINADKEIISNYPTVLQQIQEALKNTLTDIEYSRTEGNVIYYTLYYADGTTKDLAFYTSVNGLPSGGTKGQVLTKKSDEEYDAEWVDLENDFVKDVKVNGNSVVADNVANIDLTGYAKKTDIPTKTSDLTNDSNFITDTVDNLKNYYKKAETYNQTEIGDLLENKANKADIPTKVSELENDEGYLKIIPIASANELGGIKVGKNLSIDTDGTLNAEGGGSGTIDYNNLENKPILNSSNIEILEINENETIAGTINLHKVSKTGSYNDLNNKPSLDFIQNSEKGAANGVATLDENVRIDKAQLPLDIVYDSSYVHTDNNFTTDLKNKLDGIENNAQVNKIETIKVNANALKITDKAVDVEVPTKISDLTNDSGFIDNTVNNLVNYYNKTETYNQSEINNLLSSKANTGDIPTKVSQLENDKNYLTEIPIASATVLGGIKVGSNLIITEDGTLSAEAGGVSSYNDLTDRPTLNTNVTTSQPVSESELITGEMVLHKISKTGDYGDLNNKPTIPAKTSDLENDSDFTTKKYVDDIVGNINTLLSEV